VRRDRRHVDPIALDSFSERTFLQLDELSVGDRAGGALVIYSTETVLDYQVVVGHLRPTRNHLND
jgi:hypothetical protein